ncbi:TPA: hypothetical protein RHV78_001709 [Escherichia coli]|nr:hypothetical protein [Escherichia coli]EIY2831794.1 hypothetical protein [Escherichia coli]HDV1460550.1 hypothetical protein [Escherichia coli]HDV1469799.1 hypothetical protein [Escherichia coli]
MIRREILPARASFLKSALPDTTRSTPLVIISGNSAGRILMQSLLATLSTISL